MRNPQKFAGTIATALGLVLALPAQAETNPDDAGAGVADIIVTARRVEERLQDVPISITVLNQQQLADRNILNTEDLAKSTPSLQVNSNFGSENTMFAFRGFTQDIGTAPTVGIYFADVVAPRGGSSGTPAGDGAGAGSMFDLQNVQVLKGPQGTLQGRNTTGGAILLVPTKPTYDLEGYVEGRIGNLGAHGLQAVLNLPVRDNFRVRLGIDRQHRDGYLRNISGIGPKDFNDIDYTAVRLSIVADLTPELENYTIASYSNSDTNGTVGKLLAVTSDGPFSAWAMPQLKRSAAHGFYDVEQMMPDAGTRTRKWQVINTTTWQATDNLTVKNIVSYAELRQHMNSPLFGSNFTVPDTAQAFAIIDGTLGAGLSGYLNSGLIPGLPAGTLAAAVQPYIGKSFYYAMTHAAPGMDTTSQSTLTEELQFQGIGFDGKLKWQGGFYFEKSSPLGWSGQQTSVYGSCSDIGQTLTPHCTFAPEGLLGVALAMMGHAPIPIGAGQNYQVARTSTRDVAVYAQATWALTDRLNLTGGFRYTWDRMSSRAQETFYTPLVGPVCIQTQTFSATGNCPVHISNSSSAPTWLIDLDYKPADNMLVYAKWARGYRAGGVKNDMPDPYNKFRPERVQAYELGLKASMHGAISGNLNIAGFYNDFRDQQVMLGVASQAAPLPPTSAPINLGKSRIYGVEADATLNLFTGLVASVGYTYLNSKVIKLAPPPLIPGTQFYPLAEEGKPLNLSPRNKVTISGTYTLPLDDSFGQLSLGATFTHTYRQRANFGDGPIQALGKTSVVRNHQVVISTGDIGILPATNLLDVNVNWKEVLGSPVDLAFFMTNVTGQKYVSWVPGSLGLGFDFASLGAPRMYGARALAACPACRAGSARYRATARE